MAVAYLPEGTRRGFVRGETWVIFDDGGIIRADIRPQDEADFAPAVEALRTLVVPAPKPPGPLATTPPIRIGDVEIPIPAGAVVATGGGDASGPHGAYRYLQRGKSYVVFDDAGIIDANVQPEDEVDFAPALEKLRMLGPR